jgi:hypothetical protein
MIKLKKNLRLNKEKNQTNLDRPFKFRLIFKNYNSFNFRLEINQEI